MSQSNSEELSQEQQQQRERIIQQIIRNVTPEILSASKRVAEEVSKSTLAEMESWRNLQEARSKPVSYTHLTLPTNREV